MKTILVDAVSAFVIKGKGIFQEMYKMLEEYPNRKIILTNADDEGIKKHGLDDMPYEVFTLKHNPDKTDPNYFKIMLRHFNLEAKDVIYFEHKEDAVKSAKSVGITAFYYDSDKKDLAALKKFIDENLN
jgi:HAD superfamily hydrolase (TIGR01509 family)